MTIVHALGWFAGVLFVVAIMSRLLTDKQVPGLIGHGTDALANIFRGVFRG